jgi:hypothetical protein
MSEPEASDDPVEVECRFSARVGGAGLATLRPGCPGPGMMRLAVGSIVRFTVSEQDAAGIRDGLDLALISGHAAVTLADGTGLHLTRYEHQRMRPDACGCWGYAPCYRLSLGSPLRRWLWPEELTALKAVLAAYLGTFNAEGSAQ